MQNKQKVTLYIPPELHRKLKIKAAVDTESMSAIVEKAIAFYLQNPEQVEANSIQGKTHQVHICPECDAPMVSRKGTMVSLKSYPGAISEDLPLKVKERIDASDRSQGETLVLCRSN